MKLLLVPILILLVATQAFSKWVMLLEYEWNKEYIAANLCENKAKPKLLCAGKCQLAKKMAQEERDASSTSQPHKLSFQEVLFSFEEQVSKIGLPLASVNHGPLCYLERRYNAPPKAIFHPPA
jgi:hypothetical protein